ncbi:MAG: DUF1302 family protein [Desulfobacula sp.]|jgi:hypothetical protein
MHRIPGVVIGFIVCLLVFDTGICSTLPLCRLINAKFSRLSGIESIELSFNSSPEYESFYLENPDRFVIDIKNSYFLKVKDTIESDSATVHKIRISQFQPDRVRIVIDQKVPTRIIIQEKDLSAGSVLILSVKLIEAPASQREISPTVSPESSPKEENLNTVFGASDAKADSKTVEQASGDLPGFERKSGQLSLTGDLKNETAYRIAQPHQFSKIKNMLNLKTSGPLSKDFSFVLGARTFYDPVYDLTDNYNSRVEKDQRASTELRDAYLDIGLGNFEFRLGNQQIVWGQAVGLFYADLVNPLNLREYILPKLEELRNPVLAANMEYFNDNFYFQMIFIPFPEFNEFGKVGSEFDFSKQMYAQDADIVYNDPINPSNSMDNSEVGFRVSKLTAGWDMSLFYLYDMYNSPVNYRAISINPPGSLHPATITYSPEYERVHRMGATFSKDYKDVIFKGEFIYNNELYFQSSNAADPDGIETSDTFDWLLGADYTFFDKLDTNFQLMQNIILDHSSNMIQKEYKTAFSVWMKTGFFDNKIEPELFFLSSLNQKDYLLRPSVTYNYSGKLKFILGVDAFWGELDGDSGIFDKSDRIYLEALYNF